MNKNWAEIDCVITNTCITCGVNFDLDGFDNCWLFIAGYVKPREAIQASARVRHLQSKTINVVFLGKLVNPAVYIDDCKEVKNPVYNVIYNNNILEDKRT